MNMARIVVFRFYSAIDVEQFDIEAIVFIARQEAVDKNADIFVEYLMEQDKKGLKDEIQTINY